MCNTPLQAVSKIPLTSFINFPFYFLGFCVFSHQTETGWDLGSFATILQYLDLDTTLFEQQNAKKLYGTTNNCVMCRWYKFWTQRYKETKNPIATSEEPWAKTGYCTSPLHTTSPKEWAEHLSQPSGLTGGHTPTLTQHEKQSCPSALSGSKQAREPVVCSQLPPAIAGVPIKWTWKWSCVQLFGTPWTVAHQAPPSLEFSRQESWSGLPFPSPGDLRDPGIKPRSAALQSDTLPSEPPGKHSKPLPEFLVWSLDNFCGLGTAKNHGW